MENYIVIYAIVPKHIYETKLLTPEEKLIAERIIYLCKKEGYCWITNKKLSEIVEGPLYQEYILEDVARDV